MRFHAPHAKLLDQAQTRSHSSLHVAGLEYLKRNELHTKYVTVPKSWMTCVCPSFCEKSDNLISVQLRLGSCHCVSKGELARASCEILIGTLKNISFANWHSKVH